MFTDMVGYSALAQSDEAGALAALDRHNRLLREIFPRYRGREIKTVGDAFLVEFESALDALQCALETQRSLHERNTGLPGPGQVRIRIGIHVGDVVESGGDVLGDAVNIASRIEPLAEPDGICLSQQVYDQVQNKVPVPFVRLPPVALKNIRLPTSVYRVVQPWEAAPMATAGPVASSGRQLAVLPLSNISPDPKDEYFADGLTEELISVLSQVRGLSVIARTSVAPYKTTPKSIAQVGAELGVDSVLEGSVRKAGNRIRITLQLVDATTQRHVWASSYNRELDDVFAVQSEIAERTAEALRLELSRAEPGPSKRRPTASPEAYDLYLRGLVAAHDPRAKGPEEAIRCFEGATRLDPAFAEAFAAWANLLVVAMGDHLPMREVAPRARTLAARALELDPESSNAHAALGNIALQIDHDWERSEAEFGTAIGLNPSNVTAHRFLGLLLMARARFEEAKEEFRRVIQLDPGGTGRASLAWAEFESGDQEAGIRTAEAERDGDPTSVSHHVYLGMLYLAAGRRGDALREADVPVSGASGVERFDLALLQALVGRPLAARSIIAAAGRGEEEGYVSATDLAMLHTALGEKERALDLLEQDARDGDRTLWLYYRGVFFDPLRDEPRFLALLREAGVPILPVRGWTPPSAPR